MGYKLLGFAVWHGAKWYLRRRYGDKPRKLLAGAVVGGAVLTGAAMAARQGRSDRSG